MALFINSEYRLFVIEEHESVKQSIHKSVIYQQYPSEHMYRLRKDRKYNLSKQLNRLSYHN